VVIATRTYDERFGAADNLVRTLMFSNPAINNPAYKDRVFQFQVGQVLHPMMWSLDYENSRDLLWPDPNPGPLSDHLIVTKMSGTPGPSLPRAEAQAKELERLDAFDRSDDPRLRAEAQDMRAIDALNNIHQAALEDKDAQAAMQKVREAFQALDDAVRAAMKKDPAINELVEKYPNLFYGRRDLGLTAGGLFIQS
jgi:hypothetical protein